MGSSEQESRKGAEQTEDGAGARGGGQLGALGPAMPVSLFSLGVGGGAELLPESGAGPHFISAVGTPMKSALIIYELNV